MEFVPVEMLTLQASLVEELLLLDLPLKILKERPILVVAVLLDRFAKMDPVREGDGGCPTGLLGGDSRNGDCVGMKFCISEGGGL